MTKPLGHLTWRDGVATLVTFLALGLYAAFLAGAGLPLVSGARGLAIATLVLGIAACAVGATESSAKAPAKQIGAVLGPAALIAFLITVVTGNEIALAVFFGAFVLLWVATTVQHAVGSATTKTPAKTMHKVG